MPCIHCATAILFLDNQFCWAKHFTTVIMVNYSKIPQQIAVYFHGCWYFQTDYVLEKKTEPVWDVEYSNSGSNERLVHFLVKHSLLYSSNLVNPIFAKLLVTRCHRSILFSYWTVWSFFFRSNFVCCRLEAFIYFNWTAEYFNNQVITYFTAWKFIIGLDLVRTKTEIITK